MLTSSKAALAAIALLVPVVALSGLVGVDHPDRPGATSHPQGGYTLRCWQDGRLILEEQYVSMPLAIDGTSTRLQVIDRNRQPIYIAETKNATCMVKARPLVRPTGVLP